MKWVKSNSEIQSPDVGQNPGELPFLLFYFTSFLSVHNLFRRMCQVFSKFTINTPKPGHVLINFTYLFGVSIVEFDQACPSLAMYKNSCNFKAKYNTSVKSERDSKHN